MALRAPVLPTQTIDVAGPRGPLGDALDAARRILRKTDFDESKHPRSADGEFGSGGASASAGTTEPKPERSAAQVDARKYPTTSGNAPLDEAEQATAKAKLDSLPDTDIEHFRDAEGKPVPQIACKSIGFAGAAIFGIQHVAPAWSTVESVPMSKIGAGQSTVTRAGVEAYVAKYSDASTFAKEVPGSLPILTEYKGVYYAHTGHHRVAALMLGGRESLTARVYRFEDARDRRGQRTVEQVRPPKPAKAPPKKRVAKSLLAVPSFAKAEEFDESKHPRADDGKFGSGSGSSSSEPKSKPAKDKPAKPKVARRKLADNGVRLDVGDETSRVKAHESEGVLYVDSIQQWAYSPEERAATFHAILAEAKRRPDVYVVDVWLEDARQLTAAESALGKPVRFDDDDRAKIDDGRPALCRFEARPLRVRGEAADALADAHDLHLQHRVAGLKVNEKEPWVTPSEDDARDIHEAMDRTWGTLDAYNEREDHSPIRVAMQKQHCFENGHGDHGSLELTGNKTTAGSKRFREMVSHELAHCMETHGDFKEKFAAFQTWMKERVEEMRDPDTRVVPWSRILSPHGLGTMSGGSSSFNEEWAQALANYVLHEEEGELRHSDPRFAPTVEAIEKVAELVGKPVKWRPGEREKMRSFKDPAPDPDAPYEMSDERRAELRAKIAERDAAESAKAK